MKSFSLLLLASLLFSCTTSIDKKEDTKSISKQKRLHKINLVDAFQEKNNIRLTQLIDSLEYIPLETNESNLLDRISQLFITEEYIIINGRLRCYLFNRKGKFIRHIGKVGKGPGEHGAIRTIDVDKDNELVYLVTNYKPYILKYNFQGKFLGKVGKDIDINDLIFINTKYYLYNFPLWYGDAPFCFGLNKQDSVIHKFKNYILFDYAAENQHSVLGRHFSSFFVRTNKDIYAKSFFNDTTYLLKNYDTLEPKFVFDCGKKKLPHQLLGHNIKHFAENDQYLVPSDITLNTDYLFVELEYRKKKFGGLYSINSANTYVVPPLDNKKLYGFYNDYDGGLPFWPVTTYGQNKLVGYINTYQLKDHIASETNKMEIKNQQRNQALLKMASQVTVDDNPIIVIATVKNDCNL